MARDVRGGQLAEEQPGSLSGDLQWPGDLHRGLLTGAASPVGPVVDTGCSDMSEI